MAKMVAASGPCNSDTWASHGYRARGMVGAWWVESAGMAWGRAPVAVGRMRVGHRRSALSKLVSDFSSFYLPSVLPWAYTLSVS